MGGRHGPGPGRTPETRHLEFSKFQPEPGRLSHPGLRRPPAHSTAGNAGPVPTELVSKGGRPHGGSPCLGFISIQQHSAPLLLCCRDKRHF